MVLPRLRLLLGPTFSLTSGPSRALAAPSAVHPQPIGMGWPGRGGVASDLLNAYTDPARISPGAGRSTIVQRAIDGLLSHGREGSTQRSGAVTS
jgi:hypothetical protein